MAFGNAVNATTAGIQSLTSAGVFNGRTLTGTANQVAVANGDGISGNPTISLTSTIYVSGISFDSGSNTLSNYSIGTFTPTITNVGSAPTLTYTTQVGRYTYIGNRVFCIIVVVLNTYAAGTGNVQISSLPFTSNNTSNNNSIGSLFLSNVTFGLLVLYYTSEMTPNSTALDIVGYRTANTALNLDAAGPFAAGNIYTSIVYEV